MALLKLLSQEECAFSRRIFRNRLSPENCADQILARIPFAPTMSLSHKPAIDWFQLFLDLRFSLLIASVKLDRFGVHTPL
jgi:hypothetical protein